MKQISSTQLIPQKWEKRKQQCVNIVSYDFPMTSLWKMHRQTLQTPNPIFAMFASKSSGSGRPDTQQGRGTITTCTPNLHLPIPSSGRQTTQILAIALPTLAFALYWKLFLIGYRHHICDDSWIPLHPGHIMGVPEYAKISKKGRHDSWMDPGLTNEMSNKL